MRNPFGKYRRVVFPTSVFVVLLMHALKIRKLHVDVWFLSVTQLHEIVFSFLINVRSKGFFFSVSHRKFLHPTLIQIVYNHISVELKDTSSATFFPQRKLSGPSANSSPSNSLPVAIIHPQGLISSQWAHQNYYSSSTCLYYPISLLSLPFGLSLPISHLVRLFTFHYESFQAFYFTLVVIQNLFLF